jgi:phenylpropionate dioxygenase-like ring-hydroxylating dioxygenase large terminal subunit
MLGLPLDRPTFQKYIPGIETCCFEMWSTAEKHQWGIVMTLMGKSRTALSVPHAVERTDRIPSRRYYDPEFYAMECELLWPHVWQMACRLAEIPNPGDFVEYEILDKSIIVVRVDETTVRAYHNACRHRGVELVKDRGNCRSGFICPFHGWCYGLDGANTFIYQPDLFDESNRQPADVALAPCRVEISNGCAFINLDDKAPGLRESIEPFASMFDAWKAETLWPEWHLAGRLPVNWKLAMEAFMEGYHSRETHPQLSPYIAAGTADVYRDVSTGLRSPFDAGRRAGKSPDIDSKAFIDEQISFMRVVSEGMQGEIHEKDVRIAEGLRNLELPKDLAGATETWYRELNTAVMAWNERAGIDCPDLHMINEKNLNRAVFFCFPNYFLLPTFSSASSYRIRPLGPEECLFELWSLTRYRPGTEPLAPPTPVATASDDPRWPKIPGQDYSNLPKQQKGLHAGGFDYMRLSPHVEGLISNYQRLIDGHLAGLDPELLLQAAQRVSGPFDGEIVDIGF